MVLTHPHPSYTNPNLPTKIMRRLFKGFAVSGDPEKSIDFVYEYFTTTPDPLPLAPPLVWMPSGRSGERSRALLRT